MRNRNNISKCLCDYCGSSYELFYEDVSAEYICSECLNKEEEQEEEPEDNYPLDMTYNELAKWRNT